MKIVSIINSAEAAGAENLILNWNDWEGNSQSHSLIILGSPGVLSDKYSRIFSDVTYLRISYNPIRMVIGAFRAYFRIKQANPDVIHTHLLQSDLLGLILPFKGKKLITTVHSASLLAESRLLSKILQKVIAKCSSKFAHVISTSPATTIYCQSLGYKVDKVEEIHNVSRFSLHSCDEVRKFGGAYLSLSRWHPVKDHVTLLNGFALHILRHKNCDLILSGDGIDIHNLDLEEMLSRYNLKDRVIISTNRNNVQKLLEDAKALVISSITESFSMAALESFSISTPVVISQHTGYENFSISHELSFGVRESKKLAQSMDYLCSMNIKDYSLLIDNVRSRNLKFGTVDEWVNAHLKLYRLP